ncbi:Ankyrin repeat-containing domain [Penicillium camemberti]|uniref:Ankyrin repeat-containing domain n=1 Tax=Penicillium camemberti (strain FM 013) TaxID=1429867 RepID=A0A0G4PGH0_PENC3|nr:Ankyrin repeat-containing domain [Penicillium camemberti]
MFSSSSLKLRLRSVKSWTPAQILVTDPPPPRTDVNCVDQNGDTPLLLAVKGFNRGGSIQNVFSLLLNRDLNINHPDSNGRTALWHAIKYEDTSLVELLLRQNDLTLNDVDRWGFTPLARSAENESTLPVKLLLRQSGISINACSNDVVPPLWAACRAGRYDVVTLLLGRSSIDVNQKGPSGTTPLQVATINDYPLIVSALLRHTS